MAIADLCLDHAITLRAEVWMRRVEDSALFDSDVASLRHSVVAVGARRHESVLAVVALPVEDEIAVTHALWMR